MQSQQEADVDALEQLEEARYGLVDAVNTKNEVLNQGKMPQMEGELWSDAWWKQAVGKSAWRSQLKERKQAQGNDRQEVCLKKCERQT
jgi:hypothetical protein